MEFSQQSPEIPIAKVTKDELLDLDEELRKDITADGVTRYTAKRDHETFGEVDTLETLTRVAPAVVDTLSVTIKEPDWTISLRLAGGATIEVTGENRDLVAGKRANLEAYLRRLPGARQVVVWSRMVKALWALLPATVAGGVAAAWVWQDLRASILLIAGFLCALLGSFLVYGRRQLRPAITLKGNARTPWSRGDKFTVAILVTAVLTLAISMFALTAKPDGNPSGTAKAITQIGR